jgi:antitoxin ParD1/3/4
MEISMPSINVSLTEELIGVIQQKISTGMYNNASEFIREAIRNIDKNEDLLYELKLARLKETLQAGINNAENAEYAEYSYDKLMQDIDIETSN